MPRPGGWPSKGCVLVDRSAIRWIPPVAGSARGGDHGLLVWLPAVVAGFVLLWPGWWAAGAAVLAYGCGLLAMERLRTCRRMTDEIAATLGRLAEATGASQPGHAERSFLIATAIGRRIGVEGASLETVGHAARTRQVGRVGVGRNAGGRPGFDQQVADQWSAAILRRAPGLAAAAEVVAPGDPGTVDDHLASVRSVVQVATAFDEARCAQGLPADQALAAVASNAPPTADAALTAVGDIFGVVRPSS